MGFTYKNRIPINMDDTPEDILTAADRYLTAIEILCKAMIDFTQHPDTHCSDEAGMKLANEIAIAHAFMGKVNQ